jgi:hypothetical protein
LFGGADMSALFDSARFHGFPKNRYEALDGVQDFFKLSGIDLGQVFETLLNSSDGDLAYRFGDIEIQFNRGFAVWSQNPNAVQMSIEIDDGKNKECEVYEYVLKDLKLVKRKKKSITRRFGLE